MSHTVQVAVKFDNEAALMRAIEKEREAGRLTYLGKKEFTLFDGKVVVGHGVSLKDWQEPVVIDLKSKTAHYDNYKGEWGQQKFLDHLTQRYVVETQYDAAAAQGYLVNERTLANGEIELEMTEMAAS